MARTELIEDLFARAIALHDAEREPFLQSACAGDTALRSEVEALLRAHESAGDFLRDDEATAVRSGAHRQSSPANVASAPLRVPGFRLDRILGEGGLGTVYEAWDEKLHRKVALKILHAPANRGTRSPVLDEARKAAALRDPAIVTIHAVLDDQEPPAIVMELVEGFAIDYFAGSLTFQQKARVLQEIARALSVAHRHGIVHRDLKPANVLLTPAFKPYILDFGLAVSLQEAQQRKAVFEGTPLYASPEQVALQPLTAASDVFSFGSLMFKVLTGRAPFEGAGLEEVLRNIREAAPPFPRDLASEVPEDLQAICLACLAANPKARPTAEEVALELGRYLAGEPARLRPALYSDILRKRISEYAQDLQSWERQGMISTDEKDRLDLVQRRILADEDHWIIDARRLTLAQTILYTSTWVVVVAAGLLVWLVRADIAPVWRWLLPALSSGILLGIGWIAERRREALASASFLAGAVLSLVPTTLSLLTEWDLFAVPVPGIRQLFTAFTNQQVLVSCVLALALSVAAQARLRMTGFAWTTCFLATATWLACLLPFNWLEQRPEVQALWTLPLILLSALGWRFEAVGRVRWAMPFHLTAMVVLVAGLDVMASSGPTLTMLGLQAGEEYLNAERLEAFSFALNGLVFLVLMVVTERAKSLDFRRGSRLLEVLAMAHLLTPLYLNAQEHREDSRVLIDVAIYLAAVLLLLALGPWRARWRLLVGALGGVALGSYLLLDLNLVPKRAFVLGLGVAGLVAALLAYGYLRFAPRRKR